MATIHRATLTPGKLELVGAWLADQPWAPQGEIERVAAYRFDDPAGHVGIEGLLLSVGGTLVHLPVTYRDAPLAGAERFLIGTMEHSVLGPRWVYDGCIDPVAVRALLTAVLTGAQQAEQVLIDDGEQVATLDPTMQVHGSGNASTDPVPIFDGVSIGSLAAIASVQTAEYAVDVLRLLDGSASVAGDATLDAEWPGGTGTLVAVRHRH